MNQIVAIVILVGVLAIVIGCFVDLGLSVYKTKQLEKNTKFPPWPAKCPDYWVTEKDVSDPDNPGSNIVHCRNVHGLGDCLVHDGANLMKFEGGIWTGARGQYYKCNWAKQCKTSWEGIDSLC